jgi:hypothetical protein
MTPFAARLEIADKISPAQMGAVNAAMERAVGETALSLESQMILLATAGERFAFSRIAGHGLGRDGRIHRCRRSRSPNLVRWRPVVSGALITTVTRSVSRFRQCSVTTFSSPAFAGYRGDGQLRRRARIRVRAQIRRSRVAGIRVSQMRRYSQRQNLSTLSEINITPLLDLAFVLLIIFMITTPLLGKQYEPGDPIQWHEESRDQHVACANGLNRSHRRDPVQ